MSRQIDLTKKLNDDDRAYLKRRGRHWDIEANDLAFGDLAPGSNYAGEVGAEPGPGPDGTVGAAKTTTGEDPRVTAAAAAGEGEGEDDKVTVAEVRKLNKGEQEEELRHLGVEPVKGNAKAVEEQLLQVLADRGRLEE